MTDGDNEEVPQASVETVDCVATSSTVEDAPRGLEGVVKEETEEDVGFSNCESQEPDLGECSSGVTALSDRELMRIFGPTDDGSSSSKSLKPVSELSAKMVEPNGERSANSSLLELLIKDTPTTKPSINVVPTVDLQKSVVYQETVTMPVSLPVHFPPTPSFENPKALPRSTRLKSKLRKPSKRSSLKFHFSTSSSYSLTKPTSQVVSYKNILPKPPPTEQNDLEVRTTLRSSVRNTYPRSVGSTLQSRSISTTSMNSSQNSTHDVCNISSKNSTIKSMTPSSVSSPGKIAIRSQMFSGMNTSSISIGPVNIPCSNPVSSSLPSQFTLTPSPQLLTGIVPSNPNLSSQIYIRPTVSCPSTVQTYNISPRTSREPIVSPLLLTESKSPILKPRVYRNEEIQKRLKKIGKKPPWAPS